MSLNFVLPEGHIGSFAVVNLWPEIKAAEDECIARLKIAAANLGLQCLEIHADGRLMSNPAKKMSRQDIDFVIHLHYDKPKLCDIFSFVALWNPTQFYHEWGYERCSRNLLTHDDFLSCSAPAADAHVSRMIRSTSTHLSPSFTLYHSVADIMHPPSLGDYKLVYVGINWEALGRKSRHSELLKLLDPTGDLRIYGPEIFHGVKVWRGYKSYVRQIPFDGVSMVDEIGKAGIVLVLSSEAHKESEMMSNRLFEAVAAGALVICDENTFARKQFGDSLLYIDTRAPVDEIYRDIVKHVAWAKANVSDALQMIARAQEIFKRHFTLTKSLRDLYLGLSARKLALHEHCYPSKEHTIHVCLFFLMPEFCVRAFNDHIACVLLQEYESFSPVIVIDKKAAHTNRAIIDQAIANLARPIRILEVDFFTYSHAQEVKGRCKLGVIIDACLKQTQGADAVVFVAPNERILSNHLRVLAGSLVRHPETNCVATAVISRDNDRIVHEHIDFRCLDPLKPNGCARFMFRMTSFPKDLHLALLYLDRKAFAALIGKNIILQICPATVYIDGQQPYPSGTWDERQENAVITDMWPDAFVSYQGVNKSPLYPFRQIPHAKLYQKPLSHWIVQQLRILRQAGVIARFRAAKRKFLKLVTSP